MIDFVGNPITPGCVCAYPVRKGSCMWLTKITVTQVTDKEIVGYNNVGRIIRVKNIMNVIVVGGNNGQV